MKDQKKKKGVIKLIKKLLSVKRKLFQFYIRLFLKSVLSRNIIFLVHYSKVCEIQNIIRNKLEIKNIL